MFESCGDYIYDEPIKGHWLLSNAINLIIVVEVETNPLANGNEIFDWFDVEFHILNKTMRQEVVKVIKPFVKFLKAFESHQFIICWPSC
jgi:hypothetical protein